ncbi:MAG TPA: transcription termination factor NusA [Armatimonadota bacterium]|jgi:N utilization substance protein A
MSGDFLDALKQIEREKDISAEALLDLVKQALVSAYKKHFGVQGDIEVEIDSRKSEFRVYARQEVVESDPLPHVQISVDEARKVDPELEVGDYIQFEVTPEDFGRIAAQTAKQVVMQRIREAERDKVLEEYLDKVNNVITGTVQRREQRSVYITLGKIEAILPASEQVGGEAYRFGERLKVYVLEARRTNKGPQIVVSRSHPSLIRRLFELEVPEIADGVVEIKSVAREPGARSKIAVHSNESKVDPVGACVGHRGSRVQNVVSELYGEKIDIVRWSDDPATYIAGALSPAKAVNVRVNEDAKSALVIAPDNQLSLAIGKEGQNVRLAARLTGWRIDIRSEAQVAEMAVREAAKAEEAAKASEEADAAAEDDAEEIAATIVDSIHPAAHDEGVDTAEVADAAEAIDMADVADTAEVADTADTLVA